MAEKTEQPTPRRLRRAREQGDSPVSGALTQAAGFGVAVLIAPAAVAAAAGRAIELLYRALEHPERPFSPTEIATDVVALTAPLIAAAAVGTFAIGLVQTGGVVAAKKLVPDLSRANPVQGLRKLVSWQRIGAVARAMLAAGLVGWIVVKLILERAPDLASTAGLRNGAATVASSVALELVRWAAVIALGLAVVDVLLTRRAWTKRLMMTKDEVKREHREAEGDPEVKAARRRAHEEMLQSATIAAVSEATVVVVNPTHLATALEYHEDEDDAPRIVAQGRGDLAHRIVEAARAYGVPIVRDVPVARALSEIEIGDEIPEALYEAVAEILRDVWDQEQADDAPGPT